ncbi:MAG: radical SAM protein [Candidatus Lernaella stagnicola]|nr:radical SAM protein [Candidatus Lernaella stagnicola]
MAIPLRAKIGMGVGALRHRLFGACAPLNVMLAVTDHCNNRCAYCRIPELARPDPPLEKLQDLIRQMRRAGTWRLGIWGGEPLIRNDIGEIVATAKSLGMYVTIDTNGAFVDRHLDTLQNCDHVVVAYDGRRQAHQNNRCVGSHEAAVHALETLAGRVDLWTITVLTKYNLGEVDHILDLAERVGFACTFQVVHHNSVLGAPISDFLPDTKELRDVLGQIIARKEAGAPVANSVAYLEYLRAWPDFHHPQSPDPVGDLACLAGELYCNVDVDGSVYPCSLLIGLQEAPNAFELGFRRAFDGLQRHNCEACNASCYVEYNHLFALDPAVIWAWTKAMRKRP